MTLTNWRNSLENLGCSFIRKTTSAFSCQSSAVPERESSAAGRNPEAAGCPRLKAACRAAARQRNLSVGNCRRSVCKQVLLPQRSRVPALVLSVSRRTASDVGHPWGRWDWGSPLTLCCSLMRADSLLSWGDWSWTGSLGVNNKRQPSFQGTSMVWLAWKHQFWDSKVRGSA